MYVNNSPCSAFHLTSTKFTLQEVGVAGLRWDTMFQDQEVSILESVCYVVLVDNVVEVQIRKLEGDFLFGRTWDLLRSASGSVRMAYCLFYIDPSSYHCAHKKKGAGAQ